MVAGLRSIAKAMGLPPAPTVRAPASLDPTCERLEVGQRRGDSPVGTGVALHSKPGNRPEWLFYCTKTPEFAVVTALKNRNKPIATKRDKVTFGI